MMRGSSLRRHVVRTLGVCAIGCGAWVGVQCGGQTAPLSEVSSADAGPDGWFSEAGDDAGSMDSGNDSPNDDAAPGLPPTPQSIFGTALFMWLDGDAPDTIEMAATDAGVRVSKWRDRSSNKHDAVAQYYSLTGGTGLITYVPDGANGHGAMKFPNDTTNTGAFVPSEPTLRLGLKGFLVAVVAAYVNDASEQVILYQEGVYDALALLGNTSAPPHWGGTTVYGGDHYHFPLTWGTAAPPSGLNDGSFHIASVRRVGASGYVRVDGQEAKSPNDINGWGDYGAPRIGGDPRSPGGEQAPGVFNAIRGSIAEVVIATSGGTPAELSALNTYFQKKYGVPF
jgi:hypothetical protein